MSRPDCPSTVAFKRNVLTQRFIQNHSASKMPPKVPGKAGSPGDTTISPTKPTPVVEEKKADTKPKEKANIRRPQ